MIELSIGQLYVVEPVYRHLYSFSIIMLLKQRTPLIRAWWSLTEDNYYQSWDLLIIDNGAIAFRDDVRIMTCDVESGKIKLVC